MNRLFHMINEVVKNRTHAFIIKFGIIFIIVSLAVASVANSIYLFGGITWLGAYLKYSWSVISFASAAFLIFVMYQTKKFQLTINLDNFDEETKNKIMETRKVIHRFIILAVSANVVWGVCNIIFL